MHELGLTDAMVKMLNGILDEEHLEGANSVTVEVGELSGVVPRFLSDCWEAVIPGTRFEHTELKIETVPGMALCLDCDAVFRAAEFDLRCPKCGGEKLRPVSGQDMTIKEVEAY
ncbi:MAG: hydrogenase maturation nickel metallochaperone HypA [Oscillospiraceae bacterium]|nr:hydrogenase maturation nickel metallochaperone HypA [Oscillospiraceae bacterium]